MNGRIRPCTPRSICSLRYMPNPTCVASIDINEDANAEWMLGANCRPLCACPRNQPMRASTVATT
jgi:hypothetical protein